MPKASSTPQPITIYKLYEDFADDPPKGHLSHGSKPKEGTYVPGTLKRWGSEYYYIDNGDKVDYYNLCKKLFTKGQAGSLERQILENRAKIEAVESQLATPLAPQ